MADTSYQSEEGSSGLFSENPPKMVCFQVTVEYNSLFLEEGEINLLETEALSSFPEAMDAAKVIVDTIHQSYNGSQIEEVDPSDLDDDDDTVYIVTDGDSEVIAYIGVIALDYREATIH